MALVNKPSPMPSSCRDAETAEPVIAEIKNRFPNEGIKLFFIDNISGG
jgi:hypothetical protein